MNDERKKFLNAKDEFEKTKRESLVESEKKKLLSVQADVENTKRELATEKKRNLNI